MIKKIKSSLAIKVFMMTALLMAACCTITCLCIALFSPYIYTHTLSELEEVADSLPIELSYAPIEEARHFISGYNEGLSEEYDDEYLFRLFESCGEELDLDSKNAFTGKTITDYEKAGMSKEYPITFADSIEEYVLLLVQNTEKESQVVEALHKSFPVLSIIIVFVSVITAFFFTRYLTKPIKEVSNVSEQMANMDFNSLCETNRTDEIGVLINNLNALADKLGTALFELQEANQKLQTDIDTERELERQRIEFFSAASHELKTPITIIKGQLQGMIYEVGRYKDRNTYLAQSLQVTDTLERMVQELLTISRLDTPGYTCNKSNLNLSSLISDQLTTFEDLFMQKDLTVEQSISPDISALGDRQLLQKVLDNLFTNAATYSDGGNSIIVKLWKNLEKVNFTIENTGVHIPDEDIPKLFEAFYRVDRSRNRQTGGTGLGLYIVKTILDLHGAEIEIANSAQGVIVSVQF